MTPRASNNPNFYVDAMLGKIAKKLRLFGFDTMYKTGISDELLVEQALLQNRILVTKDKNLYQRLKRSKILVVLPLRNDEVGILIELLRCCKIRHIDLLPNSYTRCPIGNGLLKTINKIRVINEIPHNVFGRIDAAYRCSSCMKIYWNGTHISCINAIIMEINTHLY